MAVKQGAIVVVISPNGETTLNDDIKHYNTCFQRHTSIRIAPRRLKSLRTRLYWIGQILQGGRIQGGGCVGVLRIEDRSLAADLNRLTGSGHPKGEIHGLLVDNR
jgi:hypothetical protein